MILVLRGEPTLTTPAGMWATAPYNGATGTLGAVTPVAAEPALGTATTSYQLTPSAGNAPVITNGKTRARVPWPAAIPTYTSGENPAASLFGLDNNVVGQAGRWLWVALKGPKSPPASPLTGIWGYRRWDRLVALNAETGQAVVYPIPADWSAAVYGALWAHPPTFAPLAGGGGLVALGHWVAAVPANPAGTAALPVRTGVASLSPTAAEQDQAVTLVTQQAWASINADAAFWNCYVMANPSAAACPHGAAVFGGSALSMQTTYYNHGAVGFGLLWAMTLPLATASQTARTTAETLLANGLAGSYLTSWIAWPSAAAVRAHFHGQPPYSLPGYTRRQGYYWATASGG